MKRAIQLASVVWLCAAASAYADQNKPKNPPAPKPAPAPVAAKVPPRRNGVAGASGNPGGVPKGVGKLPPPPDNNPADWLRTMTPEQRERVIEKFLPQQQENIRKRLANFDNLPDAQKQRRLQQYNEFQALPLDKQQLVRQQMKAFNALPDDRRGAVKAAYVRLSNSTPEERANILARPQFRSRFSSEELQMLSVLPEYYPLEKKK
jgi:Protein of unknown function (DUF3106)